MNKKIYNFIFLLFLVSLPVAAQTKVNLYNDDWDWGFKWVNWRDGKPYIELSYGLGKPLHEKVTNKFSAIGLAEIKLGFYSDDFYSEEENVIHFYERFAFISQLATRLQSSNNKTNELSSEMLRFGFGRRKGYGYNLTSVKILPYNQSGWLLSKLEMKNYPTFLPSVNQQIAEKDNEIINRYDKGYRFSSFAEGGVRFDFGAISFNAGYEAAVVFPRYLFWKHIASYVIESAGLNAIDNFVDEVLDSSPTAGPIVNFVLKNAYNYAFYLLKKEKMNWPFNSETPLTYETFKFGVTFTF
jgi:hypothetical protein